MMNLLVRRWMVDAYSSVRELHRLRPCSLTNVLSCSSLIVPGISIFFRLDILTILSFLDQFPIFGDVSFISFDGEGTDVLR